MKIWTFAAAGLALGLVAVAATPSAADSRYRDKVYADSFGNLVIHSAAGYKRIIVGQGHMASQVRDFTGGGDEPHVVYLDEASGRSYAQRCPDAVLLKGRSYMYGLPDGVVPQPACR